MSRRTKALCAAFLLTAAFGFTAWVFLHRDGVSQSRFSKVEIGMTPGDVEALFGRSPDQVMRIHGAVRDPSTFVAVSDRQRQKTPRHQLRQWTSTELTAVVIFEDDRVVCRYTGDGQKNAWYFRFLRAVERSVRLR
jgi:hypothetical protein